MIWEISHAWSVSTPRRRIPFRGASIFGLPQLETQDMLESPRRTAHTTIADRLLGSPQSA